MCAKFLFFLKNFGCFIIFDAQLKHKLHPCSNYYKKTSRSSTSKCSRVPLAKDDLCRSCPQRGLAQFPRRAAFPRGRVSRIAVALLIGIFEGDFARNICVSDEILLLLWSKSGRALGRAAPNLESIRYHPVYYTQYHISIYLIFYGRK